MKYDSCVSLHDTANQVDWQDVKERLKPGAHIVSITSPLLHHKETARIEDCGVEIRDSILFLSTPPLLAVLARVPVEGTVSQTALKYGTGGLNVDGCRVGSEVISTHSRGINGAFPKRPGEKSAEESGRKQDQREGLDHSQRSGRWPANCILDSCSDIANKFPSSKGSPLEWKSTGARNGVAMNCSEDGSMRKAATYLGYGDDGSAARYFYNVPDEDKLRGLIIYLHKLITPAGGKTLWLTPPDYIT